MSLTHPLTTTAFELTGYRMTKSFGVVRGIVVRSRSIVGNFGASIQSIFGGNISLYADLCERAREDAFNKMILHAGSSAQMRSSACAMTRTKSRRASRKSFAMARRFMSKPQID